VQAIIARVGWLVGGWVGWLVVHVARTQYLLQQLQVEKVTLLGEEDLARHAESILFSADYTAVRTSAA